MRSVTRYILSPPAGDEPVVPDAPLLPIAAEPAPAAPWRGIASTDMTTAFGVPAEMPAVPDGIPAAPCACDELPLPLVAALPLLCAAPPPCVLPLAPLPMLPLAPLPMLPLDPLVPLPMLPMFPLDPLELLPMLPLPMLPVESLAPLEPLEPLVPLEPLEPLVPLESLAPLAPLESLAPLVPLAPLLPLPLPVAPLPDSSPPPRMELHPASANASKPASTTLCCLRFMINSLSCLPCNGCA